MEEMDTVSPVVKRVLPIGLAAVLAVAGFGYAMHERHAADHLAAQNQQVTAQLASTRGELNDLTAKVNQIEQQAAAERAAQQAAQEQAQKPIVHRMGKPRAGRAVDARWKKMQAQLDAQGKEIAETRSDLQGAKTELGGSIARTHDELVVLEKKGQRNYFEFDLTKEKQFKREGPVGVSLRKANVKHQYADLQLMVDDRDLTQKHVNLLQPVMFYEADSEQPIEVVINEISKNHTHGYVSAPMYRKSELASMAGSGDQAAGTDTQPAPRKKLTPQ
jgi:cell division protein FtsB